MHEACCLGKREVAPLSFTLEKLNEMQMWMGGARVSIPSKETPGHRLFGFRTLNSLCTNKVGMVSQGEGLALSVACCCVSSTCSPNTQWLGTIDHLSMVLWLDWAVLLLVLSRLTCEAAKFSWLGQCLGLSWDDLGSLPVALHPVWCTQASRMIHPHAQAPIKPLLPSHWLSGS